MNNTVRTAFLVMIVLGLIIVLVSFIPALLQTFSEGKMETGAWLIGILFIAIVTIALAVGFWKRK